MISTFARIFFNSIKENPLTSFTFTDYDILKPFTEVITEAVGDDMALVIIDEENADEAEELMRSYHQNGLDGRKPAIFIGPRIRHYQTFYGTEVYAITPFDAGDVGRGKLLVEITPEKVDRRLSQIRSLESLVLELVP